MITLERVSPGMLTLSFKYFEDYIQRVKRLGGIWNPEKRVWEIEIQEIFDLENEFKGELYYKTPRWELFDEEIPDYSQMYHFNSKVDVSKLGFKLKPFPYQEFGIQFLVDRLLSDSMGFICDDMGLGKTIQGIGALKYMLDNDLVNNVVIVCKKSLKTQWKEEIEKFVDIDADIYVAEDNKTKRYKTYDLVKSNPNKTITILNYHVLLNDSKVLKPDMVVYKFHCTH